jgi:hypothetical protein
MITGFLIREGVFCVSKAMDLFLLFHKKGLVLSLATITAFALNTFHACVTLKDSPPVKDRHE